MKSISYRPLIFNLSQAAERDALRDLEAEYKPERTDTLSAQLKELSVIRHPDKDVGSEVHSRFVAQKSSDCEAGEYGVWVYYPWHNRLVLLLEEEDFIALRTARNQHKITPDEQGQLRHKSVAVVGLSVGNSIACTIAMERVAGHMLLADFDELELSNMNRIRASLCDLGLPKSILTARQIAEIDPFIKVTIQPDGIQPNNVKAFLIDEEPIDLLVEVCDSLDIKILLREVCRDAGIPVLMDTSDRCMIDVERYDLDKNRPLLHGLADGLHTARLRDLSNPEKIPFMLKMIGIDTLSARAKASMLEIGHSIPTWPQLASTVVMGAGITTDVCRRILLGHDVKSGRYYADPEQLIPGHSTLSNAYIPRQIKPLDRESMRAITAPFMNATPGAELPSNDALASMIEMAGMAPSSGNDQPWHFYTQYGQLFLFHELSRTYSFGDYLNLATYIGLGSALENLHLAATKNGWSIDVQPFPTDHNQLVARILFKPNPGSHPWPELVDQIAERHTNRKLEPHQSIPNEHLELLQRVVESVDGARLQLSTCPQEMTQLGRIISKVDRMRILNPQGHYDFFHREIKWSNQLAKQQRTGMWVGTLEIPELFTKALEVVREPDVIHTLRAIDGGRSFEKLSQMSTANASAMGFLTMPKFDKINFLNGGIAGQRLWLMTTQLGIAFHPMIAPLYLFPRLLHGHGEGLTSKDITSLSLLRQQFSGIFETNDKEAEIYLFRLFISKNSHVIRPYRLPLEAILTRAE